MRMLFLYRGWNSGTNRAVLQAWRQGTPDLEISEHNVCPLNGTSRLKKLQALPQAVRRGKLNVFWKGRGHFIEAAKRSAWCMNHIFHQVDSIQKKVHHDFIFCVGTVTPIPPKQPPCFIYTDLAIRSNLYYPDGQHHVELWQECLPYEQSTLENATLIFTMSDHVTRSLIEHYRIPEKQILRVNGGCNIPDMESNDPERYHRQNILFIGVDWERKGGPDLLTAFRHIKKRHPRATLTLVGSSPEIDEPGVEVVGKVSQAQTARFLSRATIFCMPSLREPFGIAYLEAMRAGLPVVATNLGAAPDFVLEGQTGFKVEPHDIDTLADRIETLICDPDTCRRMGLSGRELVESQYTWQRTQQQMWQAIRQYL
ncbi:MAG: glycosyltransferase family 4 protein [Phycisphaerae bacterium]|nr:glycosyltransferase family 4 protein [Phycisphaerae bacterium]